MSTGQKHLIHVKPVAKAKRLYCWWLFSFQTLEGDEFMQVSTSNWKWSKKSVPIGYSGQTLYIKCIIKRIKKNDAITEIEIGQGKREMLSCSKFCSYSKDGILNLPSVPPNQLGHFVFSVQDLQDNSVFSLHKKKMSNFLPISIL